MDTAEILIGTARRKVYGRQDNPNLAPGEGSWLVVWSSPCADTLHSDVYAMRVDGGGRALDNSAIQVSTGSGDDEFPCVTCDGDNWLVAWLGASSLGSDVFARRVSHTGVILDTSAIALTTNGRARGAPGIVFDGLNYLVAWTASQPGVLRLYGRRVSSAGTILDTTEIPINVRSRSVNPVLASGDSWSLVVWEDSSDEGYRHIHAARVNHAGVVLDDNPAQLGPGTSEENPSVARNGDQYLVTWIDRPTGSHGVFGVLLRWPAEQPETTLVTVILQNYWYTRAPAAFDGRDFCVAYRYGNTAILSTRVSPSGAASEPVLLVDRLQDGYPGSLAAGADGSMLLMYTTTTDSINGYPANCSRVWGLFLSYGGIEESTSRSLRPEPAVAARPCVFSGGTTLEVISRPPSVCCIRIFDTGGRTVRSLPIPGGRTSVRWDGTDDAGCHLPAGVYFAGLSLADRVTTRKLLLVR